MRVTCKMCLQSFIRG